LEVGAPAAAANASASHMAVYLLLFFGGQDERYVAVWGWYTGITTMPNNLIVKIFFLFLCVIIQRFHFLFWDIARGCDQLLMKSGALIMVRSPDERFLRLGSNYTLL
jgi:hypothetical protein